MLGGTERWNHLQIEIGSQQLGLHSLLRMGPSSAGNMGKQGPGPRGGRPGWALKLGSLSPLGPSPAPCVDCATRPPSNKGKQVRRWEWVISFISKSWVTAWRVIKGKGSLFWPRQGQNSAQESDSLFRADDFFQTLFQSPCYREAQ